MGADDLNHTSTTVIGLGPPSSKAFYNQGDDLNQSCGGIDETRQSYDGKGDDSISVERSHPAKPAQSAVWYHKQRDSVARESPYQKLMELSPVKRTDGGSIGGSPFFTSTPDHGAVERTERESRNGGSPFFTIVPEHGALKRKRTERGSRKGGSPVKRTDGGSIEVFPFFTR